MGQVGQQIGVVSHVLQTPVMQTAFPIVPPRGRSVDFPRRGTLYKSPLVKKPGELQWRILHGAIAVNVFISLFNSDGTDCCPFCLQRETLFHAFMYCERLKPLFDMLEMLFNSFNVMFSIKLFI